MDESPRGLGEGESICRPLARASASEEPLKRDGANRGKSHGGRPRLARRHAAYTSPLPRLEPMKRTYQPKKRKRARTHGVRARMRPPRELARERGESGVEEALREVLDKAGLPGQAQS